MNPLAVELNNMIEKGAPAVMRVLSRLGKELYYPKGILTQSAEAKLRAHRYDATIGEARAQKHAMGLPAIYEQLCRLSTDEVLPYAPSAGRADLRSMWQEKIREKNPSLKDAVLSLPVVTSGITHGLSTIGDMFVDQGDVILVPDKLWGNYLLVFEVMRGAKVERYPLLAEDCRFDVEGFRRTVQANVGAGKMLVLLNFPNNPTGYSITEAEADAIRDVLVSAADSGCDIVAVCDDAYFGLFYGEEVMRESVFTRLADAHPSLLAIKLDGASKEEFAWGLRVAFVTYAQKEADTATYKALEKKTAAAIRGSVSNCSNLSQGIVVRAMTSPDYLEQKRAGFEVLQKRAVTVKRLLADPKYAEVWKMYPLNGGYFFCLRLHGIDAEEYRVRLLEEYGVGVISTSDTDVRVALSCVDEDDFEDLFEVMLACALEMTEK